MVSPTLFDHAFGEERRIGNIVGLRRSILDVKVGHNSHLRADDGRISPPISHPISNCFRAVGHFAKVKQTRAPQQAGYSITSLIVRNSGSETGRLTTFAVLRLKFRSWSAVVANLDVPEHSMTATTLS
jgi:hypothetical protein